MEELVKSKKRRVRINSFGYELINIYIVYLLEITTHGERKYSLLLLQ